MSALTDDENRAFEAVVSLAKHWLGQLAKPEPSLERIVSRIESTEPQRKRSLENGFNERVAFQGAEVALRVLQMLTSSRKNRA
jgi:hypothetical protein